MALKVSRKEFLGVEDLGIPEPEVMSAKMVLDFEVDVFRRMEDLGITQKDLAKMLGVTPATVSKTLSKTSNMTFKTAAKIAHALGCVIDSPELHDFNAEEYAVGQVASETVVADASTKSKDGNYRGMALPEQKIPSASQDGFASMANESAEWRMAA